MSFQVGDCVANLPAKFGNRQDLASVSDGSLGIVAVTQALAEITETYEFEELKYQTPVPPSTTMQMTAGNAVIPIGLTLGGLLATVQGNAQFPQFQGQDVEDITDVYTFWMWFSGGVNQAGRTLKYRRVTTIDSYSYGLTSNTQGSIGLAPPIYYTRFGGVLQVGPTPDENYQFFVRVKLRQPLTDNGITTATINAAGTGYAVGDTGTVAGGNPLAVYTVTSVNGSGGVTGFTVTPGSDYTVAAAATTVLTGTGNGAFKVNVTVLSGGVENQVVFTPDSWQEIIEYESCRRLALWEGASEYQTLFENELAKKGVNIAEARQAQMERDEKHNERQLSMRTSSYTFAGG